MAVLARYLGKLAAMKRPSLGQGQARPGLDTTALKPPEPLRPLEPLGRDNNPAQPADPGPRQGSYRSRPLQQAEPQTPVPPVRPKKETLAIRA